MRTILNFFILPLLLLSGCQNAHLDWSMGAIPKVSGIVSTSNGDGTETVSITGSGFVQGSTVTVSGTTCSHVVIVSSASLTCILPSTVALANIVVTNPGSGGGSGGSSDSTTPYYTLFVTSAAHAGNLGGITGANAICATAASSGSKTKKLSGSWRAIISTSSVDAKSRILLTATLPIQNTHGDTVLSRSSDIWRSSGLDQAVGYDENGNVSSAVVWTGTDVNGYKVGISPSDFCSDWTIVHVNDGEIGLANAQNNGWVYTDSITCESPSSIYCINSNAIQE